MNMQAFPLLKISYSRWRVCTPVGGVVISPPSNHRTTSFTEISAGSRTWESAEHAEAVIAQSELRSGDGGASCRQHYETAGEHLHRHPCERHSAAIKFTPWFGKCDFSVRAHVRVCRQSNPAANPFPQSQWALWWCSRLTEGYRGIHSPAHSFCLALLYGTNFVTAAEKKS